MYIVSELRKEKKRDKLFTNLQKPLTLKGYLSIIRLDKHRGLKV